MTPKQLRKQRRAERKRRRAERDQLGIVIDTEPIKRIDPAAFGAALGEPYDTYLERIGVPEKAALLHSTHGPLGSMVLAICRHGVRVPPDPADHPITALLPPGPVLVDLLDEDPDDPCEIDIVRESFAPARLAETAGGEWSERATAFLARRPPEECGCNPDLSLDVHLIKQINGKHVAEWALQHEPTCNFLGLNDPA